MGFGGTQVYQLIFYVPNSHLEAVKEAIFNEGAGKMDGYERCCWQTKGLGQFLPTQGTNPFVGKVGEVHYEEEWKVECVLKEDLAENVIKALIKAHPYEIPAYSLIHLMN